jgi:hypothetical protein
MSSGKPRKRSLATDEHGFTQINNLFSGRSSLLPDQSPPTDEEIPRYPSFMKGLPDAPVERIVSTQVDLIKAIEHALSLPDDLYQTIAAPVDITFTSPFEKGGLRGIYLIKSPLTPLFQRGGLNRYIFY